LRVHHVGYFEALEDQMCSWVPSDPESPDRVDALVWACAELKGLSQGSYLEAYGVVRCRTCEQVYAERYGDCTHCHPELLRKAQNAPQAAKQGDGAPEPMTGWGSAYGAVRCGQGHVFIARGGRECPKCNPHAASRQTLPGSRLAMFR
jgi:hypothetical protein